MSSASDTNRLDHPSPCRETRILRSCCCWRRRLVVPGAFQSVAGPADLFVRERSPAEVRVKIGVYHPVSRRNVHTRAWRHRPPKRLLQTSPGERYLGSAVRNRRTVGAGRRRFCSVPGSSGVCLLGLIIGSSVLASIRDRHFYSKAGMRRTTLPIPTENECSWTLQSRLATPTERARASGRCDWSGIDDFQLNLYLEYGGVRDSSKHCDRVKRNL